MKKKIIIVIIIIFAICGLKYKSYLHKNQDLTYTVNHHFTSGYFNSDKLYNLDTIKVTFSDGNSAVVAASGMRKKYPHDTLHYKVFLEKNNRGIWKITKIYPQSS